MDTTRTTSFERRLVERGRALAHLRRPELADNFWQAQRARDRRGSKWFWLAQALIDRQAAVTLISAMRRPGIICSFSASTRANVVRGSSRTWPSRRSASMRLNTCRLPRRPSGPRTSHRSTFESNITRYLDHPRGCRQMVARVVVPPATRPRPANSPPVRRLASARYALWVSVPPTCSPGATGSAGQSVTVARCAGIYRRRLQLIAHRAVRSVLAGERPIIAAMARRARLPPR
jgi:hypothetical protein